MSWTMSWNVSVNRPQDIWHLMSRCDIHSVTRIPYNVLCHVMFGNIWTNLSFRLSPNDQIMHSTSWITLGSSLLAADGSSRGSCLLVTTFPHHIITGAPHYQLISCHQLQALPTSLTQSCACYTILIFNNFLPGVWVLWMTLVFGVPPTESLNNCVKSNFLVVYSGQMPHSG